MNDQKTLDNVIEVLVSDLTYIPNMEQRKVKETFWVRHNENPLCDAQNATQIDVLRVVGDPRLSRWWTQPGFKEWFRNQEEFRERAALLAHMALDAIQSILVNEDAQPGARINAAKLALEVSRKMPKQTEGTFLDSTISKMDKKQLEAYVSSKMRVLPSASEG